MTKNYDDEEKELSREIYLQSESNPLVLFLPLENYPFMGKSGRVDGTRELIISNSPYMIIYRVKEETVEILRILHTSKRYPE